MWPTKLRPILGYGIQSRQILLKNHNILNKLVLSPVVKCNQLRTYKNFGHRRDKPEHPIQKVVMLGGIAAILYLFINWDYILEKFFPPVDADSNVETNEEQEIHEILEEGVDKKKKKPKQKVGFRDRKVLKYFNP